MQRDLFELRFLAASICARDSARTFIEEPLPDAMRFNVHLNSSYDGNATPEFKLFPEDSGDEVAPQTKNLSAERVVELLWRDGLVPQWVDIMVVGEIGHATLLDVVACGRFIGDDSALYYSQTEHAPFSPKGPWLPVGYVEGRRFSIYCRSACWSIEDLARTMRHAPKVWSLELHGAVFDDDVLATALESPSLELLEIHGAQLGGPGLRGLSRLPRLRVLRLNLGKVEEFSLAALPRNERLDLLSIRNAPHVLCGVAGLVNAAPNLTSLSLEGPSETIADATLLLPMATELHLTFPNVPTWVLPGPRLRTLSVHAAMSNEREVAALLSAMPLELEHLHLRGTSVGDALFDTLARFHQLRYLDVVDTAVTVESLYRFASSRPSLRFFPRRLATR